MFMPVMLFVCRNTGSEGQVKITGKIAVFLRITITCVDGKYRFGKGFADFRKFHQVTVKRFAGVVPDAGNPVQKISVIPCSIHK